MSDASLYAFYAGKDIAAPVDQCWAPRRKLTGQVRQLHESLQTTALSIDELAGLSKGLDEQLQQFTGKPRLLGRKITLQAEMWASDIQIDGNLS